MPSIKSAAFAHRGKKERKGKGTNTHPPPPHDLIRLGGTCKLASERKGRTSLKERDDVRRRFQRRAEKKKRKKKRGTKKNFRISRKKGRFIRKKGGGGKKGGPRGAVDSLKTIPKRKKTRGGVVEYSPFSWYLLGKKGTLTPL